MDSNLEVRALHSFWLELIFYPIPNKHLLMIELTKILLKCMNLVQPSALRDAQRMRTFIINLKHSLERREKMESQLVKLNITHEFIEAVDGREMTDAERKNAHVR